jgi:hypothetical protein
MQVAKNVLRRGKYFSYIIPSFTELSLEDENSAKWLLLDAHFGLKFVATM